MPLCVCAPVDPLPHASVYRRPKPQTPPHAINDAAAPAGGDTNNTKAYMYLGAGLLGGYVVVTIVRELSMVGWKYSLIVPGVAILLAPDCVEDKTQQRFAAFLAPVAAALVLSLIHI